MSRRRDIEHEIHRYERKIGICEARKDKLEDAYDYLNVRRELVQNDAFEPECSYDMTYGEAFRGNLEQDSEDYQIEINNRTEKALDDTHSFMCAITRAIEKLCNMIEEYGHRIDKLEAELDSLSDDEM